MAAMILAKRASITIFRSSPTNLNRLSDHCFSSSFERGQKMNENSRDRLRVDPDENESGAAHFVADTAKEGVKMATKVAEAVGETGKRTIDAAKDGSQRIRESVTDDKDKDEFSYDLHNNAADQVVDEIQNIDGPVDTAEYRAIEKNIEDLKRAGDKAV